MSTYTSTRDGKTHVIAEMGDFHLLNAWRKCQREKPDDPVTAELFAEVQRRETTRKAVEAMDS